MAAHTGCVATSAVAEATEVKLRDGIQVPKCSASQTPATADARHCWRPVGSAPRRRRSSRTRPVAPLPQQQRQNAMARAGAVHAAMIGPEVDTAITATASSSPVRRSGSTTAGRAGTGPAMAASSQPGPGRGRVRLARLRP
jgi:hypothetical protein